LTKPILYIVPIELLDISVLDPLFSVLTETFNLQIEIFRKNLALDKAYDARRNQYYSSELLAQLITNPPADAHRMLGVTGLDIFIPVLTYIYGEAQVNGLGALTSTYRLREEFYNKPPNVHVFNERLAKEAVHELGHTYGLVHCSHPECVMASSTYIEDVDEKSRHFCKSCAQIVRQNSPH
jgi:archaemetzincin